MPVAESLDALLGLFRGLKNRLQGLHKGQPMWLTGKVLQSIIGFMMQQ